MAPQTARGNACQRVLWQLAWTPKSRCLSAELGSKNRFSRNIFSQESKRHQKHRQTFRKKILKVAFTIVSGIHHSSRCWLFGNSILLHARVHGAISNHQFVSVALRPRATRINDQRYGPAMERCTTHQSGSTIQVIKCIFEAGGDRLAF